MDFCRAGGVGDRVLGAALGPWAGLWWRWGLGVVLHEMAFWVFGGEYIDRACPYLRQMSEIIDILFQTSYLRVFEQYIVIVTTYTYILRSTSQEVLHHHQHVFTSYPIRLHPQPRRSPNATHSPRRGRSRRSNLHVHSDSDHHLIIITKLRPRFLAIT